MQPFVGNDYILRRIYSGLHSKDRNFFGIFVGDVGSGKSGSAITISDFLDRSPSGKRRFVIRCDSLGNPSKDTRIVYRMDDFLRFSTAPPEAFPKGSFVIWDETGVEGDNTQWYSLKSRITKYVMQTNRYLNRGCFLTVPDLQSIAIGSRRLLQWVFDVQERKENYCEVKPFIIWRNRVHHKTLYYFPKVMQDGILHKIVCYKIPKPDPFLELPYKKIKERMTQLWYKEFDAQMSLMKEFVKEKKISSVDDISEKFESMDQAGTEINEIEARNYILANIELFKQAGKNKVTPTIVRMQYLEQKKDLPMTKAKTIAEMVNFELAKRGQ